MAGSSGRRRKVSTVPKCSFGLFVTAGALIYLYYIHGRPQQGINSFEIAWGGDLLLKDVEGSIGRYGHEHPLDKLKGVFQTSDYVVAVQEGPITYINKTGDELVALGRGDPCCHRPGMSYGASPQAAIAEARAGINAVSLANNHMFDRGEEGFQDTLDLLDSVGIEYFGGGKDAHRAAEPLVIDTPCCGKVCVVGLYNPETKDADKRRQWWSAKDKYGNGSRVGIALSSEASIAEGYTVSKSLGCRIVIGSIHWGTNYASISEKQMETAKKFAIAGYDLVIGHHPHVIQPFKMIDGVPVLFSLGNLAFGTRGRFSEEFPGYGLIAKTAIDQDGLKRIEFHCTFVDNRRLSDFQPRLCTDEEAHDATRLLQVNPTEVINLGTEAQYVDLSL